MTDCDLETSVPDWLIDHPETQDVFERYGIDCSCGGKSLEYACRQRGLEPITVLRELQQRVSRTAADDGDGRP